MLKSAGALFYCVGTKRYLFLLRNSHKHKNTWCFPGGKIHKNETEFEGALREIREEIGITAVPEYSFETLMSRTIPYQKVIPIEKFTSDNQKFEYHSYVFVIRNEFMPLLNNEHHGYCWTSLNCWPKPLHPALYGSLTEDSIKKKLKIIEQSFINDQQQ